MNEQPTTPEQVSIQPDDSTQEDKESNPQPVSKPSVKIQNMNHLFSNIFQQMAKNVPTQESEQDDDYEKLVDEIDNELSDDDEDDDDDYEDNRWKVFNKLLDSQQILCESFMKLLNEDNE